MPIIMTSNMPGQIDQNNDMSVCNNELSMAAMPSQTLSSALTTESVAMVTTACSSDGNTQSLSLSGIHQTTNTPNDTPDNPPDPKKMESKEDCLTAADATFSVSLFFTIYSE
jgi:hypothetical protein